MTEVKNDEGLTGEVESPQFIRRFFKTLAGLADYIASFNITNGGFAYGNYEGFGACYMLEYPYRSDT